MPGLVCAEIDGILEKLGTNITDQKVVRGVEHDHSIRLAHCSVMHGQHVRLQIASVLERLLAFAALEILRFENLIWRDIERVLRHGFPIICGLVASLGFVQFGF